ncbi:MAG: UDP-N-acetylmuramoyl-L-alanine--D-glutamate ligase [bacterium]
MRPELAGARALVVGLGRAGRAAAGFLARAGAEVTGFDDDPKKAAAARLPGMSRPARRGDWSFAVVSPGIRDAHPLLCGLRRAGVPVFDELDFAAAFLPGPLVAVTGTNGKSTTAALIAAMFRAAGRRVFLGGNLAPGRPLSAALSGPPRDWYVAEVSSFQLERARSLRPAVAVLTNITPDHLDRHRSLERYARCKYRLFARQRGADRAVLNLDDPLAVAAAAVGRAGREFFTLGRGQADARVERGRLVAHGCAILPVKEIRLPGRHNLANALAACCAVLPAGVPPAAAARVLREFAGLPHRLEPVAVRRGARWVNNSMCTNPAAGARSLEAFGRPVVLITGGREKGLPRADYLAAVARHARRAVLTGENAELLAAGLAALGYRRFEVRPGLREAVAAAARRARPGETVLYSPAFASFDQFPDFQARGRAFRREVARVR